MIDLFLQRVTAFKQSLSLHYCKQTELKIALRNIQASLCGINNTLSQSHGHHSDVIAFITTLRADLAFANAKLQASREEVTKLKLELASIDETDFNNYDQVMTDLSPVEKHKAIEEVTKLKLELAQTDFDNYDQVMTDQEDCSASPPPNAAGTVAYVTIGNREDVGMNRQGVEMTSAEAASMR